MYNSNNNVLNSPSKISCNSVIHSLLLNCIESHTLKYRNETPHSCPIFSCLGFRKNYNNKIHIKRRKNGSKNSPLPSICSRSIKTMLTPHRKARSYLLRPITPMISKKNSKCQPTSKHAQISLINIYWNFTRKIQKKIKKISSQLHSAWEFQRVE